MDEARKQAVWEHNLARVHNKAIEEAANRLWELRNEGRFVVALTRRQIMTLREAIGGGKLRDHLDDVLDDEDSTGFVVDTIQALQMPFYPEKVEALFRRRDVLAQKQSRFNTKRETLTPEEEVEYQGLTEQIAGLPSGHDIKDQEARDSILESAALLKRKGIAAKLVS